MSSCGKQISVVFLVFFARGLFILTFLYPSVLESSQNDMSGPDIGGFMVSEHVVFPNFVTQKNKTSKIWFTSFNKKHPKNTAPKQRCTATPRFPDIRYRLLSRLETVESLENHLWSSSHSRDNSRAPLKDRLSLTENLFMSFDKNIIEIVEIQKLTQFTHFLGRYKRQNWSRTREISRQFLAQNHSNPYRQPRAGGPHPLMTWWCKEQTWVTTHELDTLWRYTLKARAWKQIHGER